MRELPEMLYVSLPATNETVIVKAYEKGYYQCSPGYKEQDPKILNAHYGFPTDDETAKVMVLGSMFGWDIPAVREWQLGGSIMSPKGKREEITSSKAKKLTDKELIDEILFSIQANDPVYYLQSNGHVIMEVSYYDCDPEYYFEEYDIEQDRSRQMNIIDVTSIMLKRGMTPKLNVASKDRKSARRPLDNFRRK